MKRMARPKGKKFFPVTFTLTQEQIEYLNKQPNASEIIRKILDDLIQLKEGIEVNMPLIILKSQLEALKSERDKLREERRNQFFEGERKSLWKMIKRSDGGTYYDWEDQENMVPKPDDDSHCAEDAQVAIKFLKDYDKAITVIEQKINEIKQKILSM